MLRAVVDAFAYTWGSRRPDALIDTLDFALARDGHTHTHAGGEPRGGRCDLAAPVQAHAQGRA